MPKAVHGELIVEGDASVAAPVKLYRHVEGWLAVCTQGSDGMALSNIYAKENVFCSGMVGETLTFPATDDDDEQTFQILAVVSATQVVVDGGVHGIKNRLFTILPKDTATEEVELGVGESLAITDIYVYQTEKSEFSVVAGEGGPGRTILRGNYPKQGVVSVPFTTPFICPAQTLPWYSGSEDNLNVCLIHGYTT